MRFAVFDRRRESKGRNFKCSVCGVKVYMREMELAIPNLLIFKVFNSRDNFHLCG